MKILVLIILFIAPLISLASEKSISFKSNNLTLYGTITLPKDTAIAAHGVLLIPGSGPTDRDGNQPDLKADLLKQIAESLAEHGIASFRFDKRATQAYRMLWPADQKKLTKFFSWNNFADDIRNAFLTLQKYPHIDAKNCSILGHSEGGLFAIDVASKLKPSSLILLATPGRPTSSVLTEQITALLEKQKTSDDQKKYYLNELSRVMSVIKKTGVIPTDVPMGLAALFPKSADLFLQEALKFNPTSKIKNYNGPILIMNGLSDAQVNPKLDAEALYKIAVQRVNSAAKLKLLPSLSHNFKKINTPLDPGIAGPVSETALDEINNWMKAYK